MVHFGCFEDSLGYIWELVHASYPWVWENCATSSAIALWYTGWSIRVNRFNCFVVARHLFFQLAHKCDFEDLVVVASHIRSLFHCRVARHSIAPRLVVAWRVSLWLLKILLHQVYYSTIKKWKDFYCLLLLLLYLIFLSSAKNPQWCFESWALGDIVIWTEGNIICQLTEVSNHVQLFFFKTSSTSKVDPFHIFQKIIRPIKNTRSRWEIQCCVHEKR